MSAAHLAQALPPTRLGASQGAKPLFGAPSDKAKGTIYPSLYPLPGSSYPPLLSPPVATPAAFPPCFYGTGGVNCFPNYQGYSTTHPPVGFTPPIANPAPPVNEANVQTHQQGQQEVQVTQEDFAVREPSQEPGEVHKKGYLTQKESQAALVELLVENKTGHHCSDNPDSRCTGRGTICLDILYYVNASIAPESNVGQSAEGQLPQVDTNEPLPSPHGASGGKPSSGSSTTVPVPASPSTSALASPSGPIHPPNHLAAVSSSTSAVSSLTGKRQRSEDRPEKQRRKKCTDTGGQLRDHYAPYKKPSVNGGEKRRKKKSVDEGGYFCLICKIFQEPRHPLSRKDGLKRHIPLVHPLFEMLSQEGYGDFKILEPRRANQFGDLRPLIEFCITVQSQARASGVEVREAHDLRYLYPDVAASMNHS